MLIMEKQFKILLVVFLFFTFHGYGQKEDYNWIFGKGLGLNVSVDPPVPISVPYDFDQLEGCSTISDSLGNILFYTDGVSVWNKNNFKMPNGFGLGGYSSSSTSALIVQKPLNDTLYYIFTTPAQVCYTFTGLGCSLYYSIVNIKANQGLGDVVVKNVPIKGPGFSVCEKLIAISHSNNTDIWIVTQKASNWPNLDFASFLLTPNGIDTSILVTSPSGMIIHVANNWEGAIGPMKASPNGNKIAATFTAQDKAGLYDFDQSTGVLTNPIILPGNCNCNTNGTSNKFYGVEFSPNGNLLYISTGLYEGFGYLGAGQSIAQFDISLPSGSQIIASKNIVVQNPANPTNTLNLGQLQLAPNGKIYIATSNMWMGAIDNPDIYGSGCNATFRSFHAGNSSAQNKAMNFGLPVVFKKHSSNLPLHLLTFTAKKANNTNLLNWTTAQEVNTDRFEIENSYNGREFSKIGTVKANSMNGQYSFTDNNLTTPPNSKPQTIFYRLKMLDKDGQFTYSPIRQLTINNSQFTINIFPNPAHNKLQIQIDSDKKTTLKINIITQDGKVVLNSNMAATVGPNLRSINISALQKGTYFLRVTSFNPALEAGKAYEQSVMKFEKAP